MYAHQDWNVVVLTKKNKKTELSPGTPKVVYAETAVSAKKLNEDREEFVHKRVPKDVADSIRNKRLELKLSQSDLAQRINEKPSVIQEVESMKGVYNHILLNKISRALGISLRQNSK